MDLKFGLNWRVNKPNILFFYVIYKWEDTYVEETTFLANSHWDESIARQYMGITDPSIKIVRVVEISNKEYLRLSHELAINKINFK